MSVDCKRLTGGRGNLLAAGGYKKEGLVTGLLGSTSWTESCFCMCDMSVGVYGAVTATRKLNEQD